VIFITGIKDELTAVFPLKSLGCNVCGTYVLSLGVLPPILHDKRLYLFLGIRHANAVIVDSHKHLLALVIQVYVGICGHSQPDIHDGFNHAKLSCQHLCIVIILINDVKYGFDEIIGYSLTDNSRVIKGELSSSTSTSNTSAIGRAVVGAALGGVAGAVIGGATAKQTTEYKQEGDKTIHDFTVNINVNRLSEPLVKLYIGRNEDLVNEITALINAIVVRNNTTQSK
jgi:hypothetical protein